MSPAITGFAPHLCRIREGQGIVTPLTAAVVRSMMRLATDRDACADARAENHRKDDVVACPGAIYGF